jgi:hypothetical protein
VIDGIRAGRDQHGAAGRAGGDGGLDADLIS